MVVEAAGGMAGQPESTWAGAWVRSGFEGDSMEGRLAGQGQGEQAADDYLCCCTHSFQDCIYCPQGYARSWPRGTTYEK